MVLLLALWDAFVVSLDSKKRGSSEARKVKKTISGLLEGYQANTKVVIFACVLLCSLRLLTLSGAFGDVLWLMVTTFDHTWVPW